MSTRVTNERKNKAACLNPAFRQTNGPETTRVHLFRKTDGRSAGPPHGRWLAIIRRILAISALLAAGVAAAAPPPPVYTVGVVPQYTAKEIQQIWRPVLDELERRTGLRLLLTGSPTIPAFEKAFTEGRFDFAYMNPYYSAQAMEKRHAIPLVHDAGEPLYGILVVRRDGPIREVRELDGKLVAFPSPNALGASLFLQADFRDRFHIAVVPRYVQSHSSVYLNVMLGQTAAGGGVQKTLAQQPPEVRNALRVIHRTREFPAHPFVAHSRVPAQDREKIRAAFLQLGREEAGRRLLARIPIRRIGPAAAAEYRPLLELGLERFYREE